MSDHRYTAIFGAAIVTAGAATFAVYRVLSAASTPQHEPTRPVVVVARDVPAGVPVPREALAQVAWPTRVAPPESFTVPDSVIGRVTRAPLTRGEPVRAGALAAPGAAPGLEGTILPGRRAMAVRVHEATGVSGLVRPNSRVDVLVSGRDDATGGRPTARLVMSDVRVLGVGSVRPPEGEATPPGEVPTNVASIMTLEVTPAQAEQLAAAEGQGAVQVVLRGFGSTDRTAVGETGVTAAGAAFGGRTMAVRPDTPLRRSTPLARRAETRVAAASVTPAAPVTPAASARAESAMVRVYRGGQLTVVRVEAAGAPATPPAPVPPAPASAVRTASHTP